MKEAEGAVDNDGSDGTHYPPGTAWVGDREATSEERAAMEAYYERCLAEFERAKALGLVTPAPAGTYWYGEQPTDNAVPRMSGMPLLPMEKLRELGLKE